MIRPEKTHPTDKTKSEREDSREVKVKENSGNMKRPRSDDVDTPPFKKSDTAFPEDSSDDRLEDLLHQIQEPEDIQDVEKDTLEGLKANLGSFSHAYQKEVTDATQNYYYIYIKKTLQEMPLFKELFKFNPQLIHEKSNFMQLFVLARTVVNCNLKIKKYIALNNFANAATSIVGKTLHDQFIIPLLRDVIPLKVLHLAMSEFQNEISKSTEPDQIQCVLYFIEKQLEDEERKTVYHPLTQCVAGQINASSKYIQTIIKEAAFTFIKHMTHNERDEARNPPPTPWPEPAAPWPLWPADPESVASSKNPVTSVKGPASSPGERGPTSPPGEGGPASPLGEGGPASPLGEGGPASPLGEGGLSPPVETRQSLPTEAGSSPPTEAGSSPPTEAGSSPPTEAGSSRESKLTTFTRLTESAPSNPLVSVTSTNSKYNISLNAKKSKSTNLLKKKDDNTLKKSEFAIFSTGKNSKYPF